jgi:hypothetical protein
MSEFAAGSDATQTPLSSSTTSPLPVPSQTAALPNTQPIGRMWMPSFEEYQWTWQDRVHGEREGVGDDLTLYKRRSIRHGNHKHSLTIQHEDKSYDGADGIDVTSLMWQDTTQKYHLLLKRPTVILTLVENECWCVQFGRSNKDVGNKNLALVSLWQCVYESMYLALI